MLVEALAVTANTVGDVDGRVGGHVPLVDRVRPLVGVNVSCVGSSRVSHPTTGPRLLALSTRAQTLAHERTLKDEVDLVLVEQVLEAALHQPAGPFVH